MLSNWQHAWAWFVVSGAKKAPKPNFLGKFCRQKILGKFWPMGDQKKVWVFRVCSLIFFIMGGMPPPIMKKWDCKPWTPKLFFDPPLSKISPNFSVYKISPKSLVWVLFWFLTEELALETWEFPKLWQQSLSSSSFKGINRKRDDILRWVSLSDFAERFRNRSAKFRNRSAQSLSETQRKTSSRFLLIPLNDDDEDLICRAPDKCLCTK